MIVRTAVLMAASLFAGAAAAANPPILVTSGVDNGTDGAKTTLREALQIAARRAGAGPRRHRPFDLFDRAGRLDRGADRDPVTVDADPDDDGVGRLYAYVRVSKPFFVWSPARGLTVIGALFENASTVGKMGNAGEPGVWGTGGAAGVDHSELLATTRKACPAATAPTAPPGSRAVPAVGANRPPPTSSITVASRSSEPASATSTPGAATAGSAAAVVAAAMAVMAATAGTRSSIRPTASMPR